MAPTLKQQQIVLRYLEGSKLLHLETMRSFSHDSPFMKQYEEEIEAFDVYIEDIKKELSRIEHAVKFMLQ